jgi:hypothetical protein
LCDYKQDDEKVSARKENRMRSKNVLFWVAGLLLTVALTMPLNAQAGINVDIGINLAPPAYVIHKPPPVAVIPGSYVYFVPGVRLDILFYHGYWYRPYEGRWYRGRSYNGPWHQVVTRRIPSAVLHIPPDYRRSRHSYRSVPYGRMEKNWRKWERDRYWDRSNMKHVRERRVEDRRDNQREHGRHGNRGRGAGRYD